MRAIEHLKWRATPIRLLMDRIDDTLVHLCRQSATWVGGRVWATMALVLAIYIAVGFTYPLDLANLLTGDSLYPVQMGGHSLLDYRPPPPNRLFPDVAVHALIGPWIEDPLTAKIVAGAALFSATLLAIGWFKPLPAFFIAAALMGWPGFTSLNSATHFTMPLLIILVQLASRNRFLDAAAFALAAFFNILAVLPLAILLFDGRYQNRMIVRTMAIGFGIAAAALYSDFGRAFFDLAFVLPVWFALFACAYWAKAVRPLALLIGVAMLAATPLGLMYERYAVPVAISMLMALTPIVTPNFDWRRFALPLVLVATILVTGQTANADRMRDDFSMVARELHQRGITVVATDHWTSKPLYFAAKAAGYDIAITQTNFVENFSHAWMAPYSFVGSPTPWALRSWYSCVGGPAPNDPRNCEQGSLTEIATQTELGDRFTLYRYVEAVPRHYQPPPESKVQAINRQFHHHLYRVLELMGIETQAPWERASQ